MDSLINPFSPGAGTPPHELAGRSALLEQASLLIARTKLGRSEKSLLLVGLRGVGKTVLLNDIRQRAESQGFESVFIEAVEDKSLALLLIPQLKTLLYKLDRLGMVKQKTRRAIAVLRSFVSSIKLTLDDATFGIDIEPEKGAADSGDLEVDLPNVLIAVGDAAKEAGRGVVLLIDELQYLNAKELGALIMAIHQIQQRQLPVCLVGAGLPTLPGLAGTAKSYAERLFGFPEVGQLSPKDSEDALQLPVRQAGVEFTPEAIEQIIELTQGYPYFLQEWGYMAWNQATQTPITAIDVNISTPKTIERLDSGFFKVRFNRLTPAEKRFLRAMAELGPLPLRTADIADALKVNLTSLGPVRAKLINKGMIYSPAHGELAFTVPMFDEFMKRAMP